MDLGAQLDLLPRALGHDLRHALLCLLSPRPQLAHRNRPSHDPDLPDSHHPHTAHARQQHQQVVGGLEQLPHLNGAKLRPLPVREWHAGALARAHARRHPCAPCTPCTRLRRSTLPRSSSPSLPPPPCFTFGRSCLVSLNGRGSGIGGNSTMLSRTGALTRESSTHNNTRFRLELSKLHSLLGRRWAEYSISASIMIRL